MPVLKLTSADGLLGVVKQMTLRTEQIEAVWDQESPTAGYEAVNVLFKSGQTIRLDVENVKAGALHAKIAGAL
jgi:hypothetical protein